MSRYRQFVLLLMLIMTITVLPASAAVDFGGELKTTLTGNIAEDGEIDVDLRESLDLEIFLPEFDRTEAKVQFQIFNPPLVGLAGEERILFKKLYLRRKFEQFDLTVGRQPVSWSFGSLLNPVDFSLGAVAMEEETAAKYIDAVDGYLPFNWNSGLELVAAQPENSEDLKWGIRGRAGLLGYDLTLNYVHQPEMSYHFAEKEVNTPAVNRAGITAKGDLGPIGIYGAVGAYRENGREEEQFAYLLGGDYSYQINFDKRLMVQVEYLRIKRDNLGALLGSDLSSVINGDNENLNLFLGNVNYPIDDFTSISLIPVVSLDDGSLLLNPRYTSFLGNNLTLSVSGAINIGDEQTLFGPKDVEGSGEMVGALEVSLSYPF